MSDDRTEREPADEDEAEAGRLPSGRPGFEGDEVTDDDAGLSGGASGGSGGASGTPGHPDAA